jgi:uncharacterized membrane protein YbhN (UPF0104 family)
MSMTMERGAGIGRAAKVASVISVVAAGSLLYLQLRSADLGSVLRHTQWSHLVVAVAMISLSVVAAAYNLIGFTPQRLRLLPTIAAQLAVSGLRMVVPSAVSTPAIATRYLTRSGASAPDALASIAAAQAAQLLATTTIVAGIGVSGGRRQLGVDPTQIAVGLIVLALVVGAVWLLATSSHRFRNLVRPIGASAIGLLAYARGNPTRVLVGCAASAALTVTHILAFAFCVSAVGGQVSLLQLTMIYLAAAGAGSLIPSPGGVGPVEAALIAGLTAAGVDLPVAAMAALLSRIVSVWLLAVPGCVSLFVMRRRQLL